MGAELPGPPHPGPVRLLAWAILGAVSIAAFVAAWLWIAVGTDWWLFWIVLLVIGYGSVVAAAMFSDGLGGALAVLAGDAVGVIGLVVALIIAWGGNGEAAEVLPFSVILALSAVAGFGMTALLFTVRWRRGWRPRMGRYRRV